jgi:hypothetical protein
MKQSGVDGGREAVEDRNKALDFNVGQPRLPTNSENVDAMEKVNEWR